MTTRTVCVFARNPDHNRDARHDSGQPRGVVADCESLETLHCGGEDVPASAEAGGRQHEVGSAPSTAGGLPGKVPLGQQDGKLRGMAVRMAHEIRNRDSSASKGMLERRAPERSSILCCRGLEAALLSGSK